MMTPDELRALADALYFQGRYGHETERQAATRRVEERKHAADYLRAQADAQPVPVVPVDWTGRLKEAVKHIGYANVEKWYRLGGEDMIEQAKSDAVTAYATLCEALESLAAAPSAPQGDASRMIDALQSIRAHVEHDPSALAAAIVATCDSVLDAAPQAEPIDPHMIVADDRFPDEQAEPKRDWSVIDAAIREYLDGYEQIGEDDAGADACYTPTERERDLIYDAINGLLADESFVAAISAPQAEPSAALIRAHNSGYMQGHQDTVEAQFIVIHPLDMNTYHADVVAELGLTAAPQAEPCIGNDSACPCQDGDACHYKDAADGTKAWPVPQAEPIADSDADYWLRNRQAILDAIERAGFVLMSNASGFWLHPRGATDAQAEPKREPLSDEQIDEEATNRQMTAACEDAFYDGVRWAEHSHEIGGSDAE